MPEWTQGAQDVLNGYLNRLRDALGDDPEAAEVVRDMESHVEEEASRLNRALITADDMEAILGRLGSPDLVAADRRAESAFEAQAPGSESDPMRNAIPLTWRLFVYIFAIFFPLLAIGIALVATPLMEEVLVDVFPTDLHALLCLLTVVGVALGLRGINRRSRDAVLLGISGSGFAIGVGAFYILALAPHMLDPLVVVFCLIAFAPLWCFVAGAKHAVTLGSRCCDHGGISRRAFVLWLGIGVLIPLFYLVGFELHRMQALVAVETAAGADEVERADALEYLRGHADEEDLRRRCYHVSKRNRSTLLGYLLHGPFASEITLYSYRDLYYRLYGRPFNALPIEAFHTGVRSSVDWENEWEADWIATSEQGGEQVGSRVRTLSLKDSVIDGSIDTQSAIGYMRWTMIVGNKGLRTAEARMQILIPHNAVATQLSLFIDGEEKHAVFDTPSKTLEAYEAVVKRQRDPALLASKGTDRLMLRIFPVPSNGEMRVRIGLVVPLLERGGRQHLILPRIIERNFGVPETFKHEVWLNWTAPEGPTRMDPPWSVTKKAKGLFAFRADFTDEQLLSYRDTTVSMASPVGINGIGSTLKSPAISQYRVPLQSGPGAVWATGGPVVLVVDGSVNCPTQDADEWIKMLEAIPDGTPVGAVFVGDLPVRWKEGRAGLVSMTTKTRHDLASWLAARRHVGGRDPVPALEQALDLVPRDNGGLVVWIHGTVPARLSGTEGLYYRWSRFTGWAKLIAFAMVPGPNRILEKIATDGHGWIAPRLGKRTSDFRAALESLRYAPLRSATESDEAASIRWTGGDVGVYYTQGPPSAGIAASAAPQHLSALWAKARTDELFRNDEVEAGGTLAKKARIVTDHSSAVVLESEEQYKAFGLDVPPAGNFAGIPEPSTLALMALGLGYVAVATVRKTRRR